MANRLLIIGKSLYSNPAFYHYIEREIRHLGFLEQVVKIPETGSDTPTLLQQQIDLGGNLVIVTTKQAFAPVSKLIATITGDALVLKENILIPSKSDIYDDHSFLVRHQACAVNVVQAQIGKTLPMFLIDHKEREGTLHLFDMDPQSAEVLLAPLANSHDIETDMIQIVPGWIRVDCSVKKYGHLGNFLKSVRQLFAGKVIESTNIFAYLVHRLSQAGKSVTFAESCTGGLLAEKLTSEPGASNIFRGSLVTYANGLKAGWLGVEKEVLTTYGAVSEPCVEQMVRGAMEITKADYAVAVSGIAGPGGGTPEKPVGTVFIGAGGPNGVVVERLHFEGDREYIREQSLYYGYKLLFRAAEEDLF